MHAHDAHHKGQWSGLIEAASSKRTSFSSMHVVEPDMHLEHLEHLKRQVKNTKIIRHCSNNASCSEAQVQQITLHCEK
jgi:hypothetical protein